MKQINKRRSLEELVRRHGVPQAPTVVAAVGEVRSNWTFPHPPKKKGPLDVLFLGEIIIQWEFCVPLIEAGGLNDFLDKNEKFIATSAQKLMKGVNYRGTYFRLNYSGACYKTIWAYDTSQAAEDQWGLGLADRNFREAIKRLRAFWLLDPNRTEDMFGPAQLFDALDKDGAGNPFVQLTLEAVKLNQRRASRKQ
jgi:hypothetical protein